MKKHYVVLIASVGALFAPLNIEAMGEKAGYSGSEMANTAVRIATSLFNAGSRQVALATERMAVLRRDKIALEAAIEGGTTARVYSEPQGFGLGVGKQVRSIPSAPRQKALLEAIKREIFVHEQGVEKIEKFANDMVQKTADAGIKHLSDSRLQEQAAKEGLVKTKLIMNDFKGWLTDPRIMLGIAGTIGLATFLSHLSKHGAPRLFINVPNAVKETSILSPRQRLISFFTGRKRKPSVRHELHYNDDEQAEIDRFADTIVRNAGKGRPLPHALFWGPPGTGKTAFAKEIARSSGADYIIFSANELLGGSMENAVQSFSRILAYARSSRKKACIVFIDEADSVFGKRRIDGSGDIMQRITNMFLENTEKTSDRKLCFIMATNIPQALSGPVQNRLGVKLKFSAPVEDVRHRILRTYLEKFADEYNMLPADGVLDGLGPAASESEGLVGRDLEAVAQSSYNYADGDDALELSLDHVLRALRAKKLGGAKIAEDANLASYL